MCIRDSFYYASENTGFKPNIHRTEGTYTKYSSIDDQIDGFHHWFSLLKFGIGRCTANAAREIREGYITREEGISLVNRYDSEFPKKYFSVFLNYSGLSEEQFWKVADRWRNKRIWIKKNVSTGNPGDDWEKINVQGEKQILDVIYKLTIKLSRESSKPLFTLSGPKKQKNSRSNQKVKLGIIPYYGGTIKGLKVDKNTNELKKRKKVKKEKGKSR